MAVNSPDGPELNKHIWSLYREFFNRAERRRRWSIEKDVPWEQCNPNTAPEIADVVETFCAVELFLPDYVGKALPLVRGIRGRAWFLANWGYEESKHSLVLQEWLVRSGHRTWHQIEEASNWAVFNEWNLPQNDIRGMSCYTMCQELATWLHYRNLRNIIGNTDPALNKILQLVSVDERAHFDFYVQVMKLHLADDRQGTLSQLKDVLNGFAMPATHLMADSAQRQARVRDLNIFNEALFYSEVLKPIMDALGIEKSELRNRSLLKKSLPESTPVA
ncbi:MAG: acyl-ACP desaturase [Gemmataceae bacterium]